MIAHQEGITSVGMTGLLAGKNAMVTGGAHGIGSAIAAALASEGALVTIVDRDGPAAAARASQIGAVSVELDLTDAGAVGAHATTLSGVDILVNNAGYQHVAPLHAFPPAVFRQMHRLMVEVPFEFTRAVLPGMYERRWGRVVNISSIHGIRGSAYKVAYVSAKHALEGLTKVTALEGAVHGVTCNSVCPGYVRTALVDRQISDLAAAHGEAPELVVERVLLADSAVKRLLAPEEVASAVLYLCSPGSASITGTRIVMDGGRAAS